MDAPVTKTGVGPTQKTNRRNGETARKIPPLSSPKRLRAGRQPRLPALGRKKTAKGRREFSPFWPERAPSRQSGIGGAKGHGMNEIPFPGSPALWTGSFTKGDEGGLDQIFKVLKCYG